MDAEREATLLNVVLAAPNRNGGSSGKAFFSSTSVAFRGCIAMFLDEADPMFWVDELAVMMTLEVLLYRTYGNIFAVVSISNESCKSVDAFLKNALL